VILRLSCLPCNAMRSATVCNVVCVCCRHRSVRDAFWNALQIVLRCRLVQKTWVLL
jgi:hypothetical protein